MQNKYKTRKELKMNKDTVYCKVLDTRLSMNLCDQYRKHRKERCKGCLVIEKELRVGPAGMEMTDDSGL